VSGVPASTQNGADDGMSVATRGVKTPRQISRDGGFATRGDEKSGLHCSRRRRRSVTICSPRADAGFSVVLVSP